ncbi:hypothetical protein A1O3_10152 [Capronia epimyces CBS 606.96]|uniref:Clr5 domain-containing protein n=1 Tax=Capronia epimyces CBS 606.96 TaxID=1182542 RepID=W9XI22_9EURO|nr:uncharacterized protein A1O3_10152 [Capronia epimyces CBS 606.96]EXJ76995.1 hypothetical protein A1O3_10152 [Capronia epimyces CBS 606.96]
MDLPLREVQRIMETDYHFKATKRMYNTRFKQWNICKNYKAEEKELLAARIARAHLENHSLENLTFKDRPLKFDRVLRHCKTRRRAQNGPNSTRGRAPASKRNNTNCAAMREIQGEVFLGTASVQARITPESGTTTTPDLTPPSSEPVDGADTFDIINHADLSPKPEPPILARPLSPPEKNMEVEVILYQTRIYYQNHVERIGQQTTEMYKVSGKARAFWSGVKSAIYFLKKQSPAFAWPLLNEACTSAGEMLDDGPALFLNEVFAVLSPVNTKVYPKVRSTLLRYLADMAAIKLRPTHPFAVVCRTLARGDDEQGAVSETAMNLTLDLFAESLGRGHSGTFAVHRSLVSLMRRDARLDAAKQLAEELVISMEQALVRQCAHDDDDDDNNNKQRKKKEKPTCISVTELCVAMTELVHVYMDRREYLVAQRLCQSLIQNYRVVQGPAFPDSRAAYALEDMAELCQCQTNLDGAVYWLTEALDASTALRGKEDPSTKHIHEKLARLSPCADSADSADFLR